MQVHNECSNPQQQSASYNRRGSAVSNRLEVLSPPEHHGQLSRSSELPTSENGAAFLQPPPAHRSDVIVKLTAASDDSTLNM